jgi:hypothetical protein
MYHLQTCRLPSPHSLRKIELIYESCQMGGEYGRGESAIVRDHPELDNNVHPRMYSACRVPSCTTIQTNPIDAMDLVGVCAVGAAQYITQTRKTTAPHVRFPVPPHRPSTRTPCKLETRW